MVVFHTGTPEEAERDLAPFKEWGSPLVVDVGRMPYPVMNTILDGGLSDGVAELLAVELHGRALGRPDRHDRQRFATVPSPMTAILFEHFHGAVTRVGVDRHGGAASQRVVEPRRSPASGRIRRRRTRTSVDEGQHAALKEHLDGRRWLNYLADDQGDERSARLRAELRASRRGQAQVRPAQRVPAEPEHRAVATRPGRRAQAASAVNGDGAEPLEDGLSLPQRVLRRRSARGRAGRSPGRRRSPTPASPPQLRRKARRLVHSAPETPRRSPCADVSAWRDAGNGTASGSPLDQRLGEVRPSCRDADENRSRQAVETARSLALVLGHESGCLRRALRGARRRTRPEREPAASTCGSAISRARGRKIDSLRVPPRPCFRAARGRGPRP